MGIVRYGAIIQILMHSTIEKASRNPLANNPLVSYVAKWQRDLRLQMLPFGNVCVHVQFNGFSQDYTLKLPK